ncbi:hypothetical protein AQUCO_00700812v1 [Aquilegia coerulea]|uniref:MORF/ORRM1/DAG-like MORF domain-containing protein n=1 Tax=Aquilegia coerulea TaxID=218851 RepID=A0A2G5ELT3_AQUCA|nr:hypothetical protein AQUCO_00700812v1 [Aquilegia coerulea]PIA56709.1 hypothetical protein AQUCO_00700812v1 [Aquilegia coerulea]
MVATTAAARNFSCLRLSSSQSSSIGAIQHLSSFPTYLISRRPTSSLLSIITSKLTHVLFSSSYSSTSFPTLSVSIPLSIVSHQAVVIRGVVSTSPTSLKFSMLRHQSSAISHFSTSNPTRPNWTPPLRSVGFVGHFKLSRVHKSHWFVMMETFGFEFETEQALFNHYIKTLAAVVGSDEEAKKKIYFVSCGFPLGFGAVVSDYIADKIDDQPGVSSIFKDYAYKDRKHKLRGNFLV